MKTTVIGAYPRISDDPGGQSLRQTLHKHDRGEADDAALDAAFEAATRRAIGEIEAAGVDVTNDGQVRWDDIFAPFARSWTNVSRGRGGLDRYFDNNTYFRQPTITGPIATSGTTLVADFERARGIAKTELKAAVCGPLTFAAFAHDKHYRSLEERTLAVADAVAAEIHGLASAGATLIDVEEPALVAFPQYVDLAREAFRKLAAAAGAARLALITYFYPADRILESLASFPAALIGIDVRSRETTILRRLDAFKDKEIVLGVVDARFTRVEDEKELAGLIEEGLKLVSPGRLWLAPTTSLEYLPHDVAQRKLAALVAAARAVGGVPA